MIICPDGWRDYELLDTGEGMKLERWGQYTIARADPRIIWKKGDPEAWKKADAVFENDQWKFGSEPPQEWVISYDKLRFKLRPTDFKHTGVFPEQGANWEWIRDRIWNYLRMREESGIRVLNLFAYTGGATMAAALAGAQVTHVDSSKPAMMWAGENAQLAGIKNKVRWIQDDAVKFVKREIKRGTKYDGIIMDPPRFGRGASGEVWKLEEKLPELVLMCKELLSPTPRFFLTNAYTADLSSIALGNLLAGVMGKEVEFGELGLKESSKGRILPAGIFARWSLLG